jgi:formate C-acetyltransferase
MESIAQQAVQADPWRNFAAGDWQTRVDVRQFIQRNYQPYAGDASFLAAATERTQALWAALGELLKQERAKGVLDVSADRATSITAHDAGYIDPSWS